MGFLPPPIPQPDGSDIIEMLERLKFQRTFFGFICGGAIVGFISIAIIVFVFRF